MIPVTFTGRYHIGLEFPAEISEDRQQLRVAENIADGFRYEDPLDVVVTYKESGGSAWFRVTEKTSADDGQQIFLLGPVPQYRSTGGGW